MEDKICKKCGNTSDWRKDGSCAPCNRAAKKRYYARKKADPAAYAAIQQRQKLYRESVQKYELDPEDFGTPKDRRELQQKATPPWLSVEQRADIQAIYFKARWMTNVTKVAHHVDHIIPLKHPDCCGLHVPWNLTVIPADENIKKKNDPYRDPPN